MGFLVDGQWKDEWYDTESTGGRFERESANFRDWVTDEGMPAHEKGADFPAEAGRYHLYVAYACPWSHRTLIYRSLKELEELIPISVTHWRMGEDGWTFEEANGVIADPNLGADKVYEIYQAADPDYNGHASVPILWDKKRRTIISNESADIIRMFNSAFDQFGPETEDYYPEDLREEIDALNERIYEDVNNGVYKAGFASSQEAYDQAVGPLFETLGWLDEKLSSQRYLTGDKVTEADWRLFPTLVRFDPVYHIHFKCSRNRIRDYKNLWAYMLDLYQHPGVAETVRMDHIRKHYYCSHKEINPSGIVAECPEMDLEAAHGREALG